MSPFDLGPPPPSRRPSLTPMIDVVFLLLVFFMLAARFGQDMALETTLTGRGEAYSGPPRLITVTPEGLRLNGVAVEPETLAPTLTGLMEGPEDLIILRPAEGATTQGLVDVIALLRAEGMTSVAVVE
ncbi:MAG: biopolymer transporter ExbD [Pseudomonadota bacterium]